jgi:hypothetical protein
MTREVDRVLNRVADRPAELPELYLVVGVLEDGCEYVPLVPTDLHPNGTALFAAGEPGVSLIRENLAPLVRASGMVFRLVKFSQRTLVEEVRPQ